MATLKNQMESMEKVKTSKTTKQSEMVGESSKTPSVGASTRAYYMKKYPSLFTSEVISEKERYNMLSPRMQEYYDYMITTAGVLFITSAPGLAKSSVAREIAFVMDYDYVDVRLSIADETDFGLPRVKEIEYNGELLDVHNMTTPTWAFRANQRKTIIHFEELNRCSLQVRNACLGVLLERVIGADFKFNDDVLMMASGNLGDDDGTDVEEFDSAMNNRLIHVKHDMPVDEWIEQYAKYNIHPIIVDFIKQKPEMMNRKEGAKNGEQPKAYPTQRTWFNLSEHLLFKTGDKEEQLAGKFADKMDEIKELINHRGMNFIGSSSASLVKYIDETMKLSLDNIIYEYKKYAKAVEGSNRDKKSELLNQLRERDLTQIDLVKNPNVIPNIIKFMEVLESDEIAMFVKELIRTRINNNLDVIEPYATIVKHFMPVIIKIKSAIDSVGVVK
jgi:hypothetical protein